jgi:hypothetical protein
MAQIEVGKYYSAYPEFTRLDGVRSFDRENQKTKAQKMTGLCIFTSPRSLPWHLPTESGNRSDRMR